MDITLTYVALGGIVIFSGIMGMGLGCVLLAVIKPRDSSKWDKYGLPIIQECDRAPMPPVKPPRESE